MTPLGRDEKRLEFTDPELVKAYLEIRKEFREAHPEQDLTIPRDGAYRTTANQNTLHAAGASGYTGTTTFSKHQALPAQALDWLVIDENENTVKNGEDPRYRWVGEAFTRRGFLWGGHYMGKKKDWDHVEILGAQPTLQAVKLGLQEYLEKISGRG
jgi:hypothetical protein